MLYQNEILGGILIGGASALPLLMDGRIAGVTGYAASLFQLKTQDGKTGLMFVLGLILSGSIWHYFLKPMPSNPLNLNFFWWAIAGLFVGFGARLAGGCTSGHGVCGLGRASRRSFVAVIIFMTTAIIIANLMRSL